MAGRHRKETHPIRNTAVAVAATAMTWGGTVILTGATANADTSSDLEIIAQCESGNRNVESTSPSSSASGYWQIIDGTWRGAGGTQFAPRAIQASRSEQKIVAQRIAANRGSYADWNPSKPCWGSKIGRALPQRAVDAPRTVTRKPVTPSRVIDTGRAADGTGRYTCDRAHLHFDACDPGNLGEVVNYPRFDRATGRVTPAHNAIGGKHRKVERGDTLTKIAAANGTTWQAIYAKNRGTIGDNPNLILPGQNLVV